MTDQKTEKPALWVTVRANGRISFTQNEPRLSFGDRPEPLYRHPTDARVRQLIEAAEELSAFYSHIWDRKDGCIVLMEPSVPKFEQAHAKLNAAISAVKERA
ncbi:MAG: hypothetical protein J0I77_17575 [Rudaea sp.]|uniref:hypothetical protein n=1 Tax=unclassified Rudaea TaxID=2627037 RepID=UPI0010F827CA|nr:MULTISPECIES: hypothetical protein [unclassified Rudaea]MBN8887538.1 hypothetical protein [Rudaea sp.]